MNRRDNRPARPSSEEPYLEARAYPAGIPSEAMRTRPERAVPPHALRPTQPDPVNGPQPPPGTPGPWSPNGSSPTRPTPLPPPADEEPRYGPGSYFDVFAPRERTLRRGNNGAPPGSVPYGPPGADPYGPRPPGGGNGYAPGPPPHAGYGPAHPRPAQPRPRPTQPRPWPTQPRPTQPRPTQPGPAGQGAHPYAPAGPGPYGPPGQNDHPYGPSPGAAGPGPGAGGFRRADGTIIRQRDSALPDAPPGTGTGPVAAIETDGIAAFARDLRALRAQAGLDYPAMAEKSHYTMRTLASAAGGLRLPTLPVLTAYVRACGGDQAEWEERWGKLMKASGEQPALPAAGADAPTAGEVYVITSAPSRDERW